MKVDDSTLIQKIWTLQLSNLVTGALFRYVGNRYGVVEDNDFWLRAGSIHRTQRHKITDSIGKQQILKRLRKLVETGHLNSDYHEHMFFINTKQAKDAFEHARDFWLKNGVPTGYKGGRALCASIENFEHLKDECLKSLNSKFRSVCWHDLEVNIQKAKQR
ncbi:hypothetical protein [Pseudoalteromonas aurantia]|uniref:Uncharacterized protein n=1 Tax=Pseudoalteromonas aurantia 208 TaxID=1314867 RepID=A0ABR9EBP9_9GAMM|nr:hypothetical protein [Pseudoalteromonas aurantia]MBE0368257.1 hypothetical protein [Pseudoalteromonas aurantia 208]